jgi:hypothetical protein
MRRESACGLAVSGRVGRSIFLTLTLSACADAVDAVVDVFDVSPIVTDPIRLEEAQADDFIHPKNPSSSKNSICDRLAFCTLTCSGPRT